MTVARLHISGPQLPVVSFRMAGEATALPVYVRHRVEAPELSGWVTGRGRRLQVSARTKAITLFALSRRDKMV